MSIDSSVNLKCTERMLAQLKQSTALINGRRLSNLIVPRWLDDVRGLVMCISDDLLVVLEDPRTYEARGELTCFLKRVINGCVALILLESRSLISLSGLPIVFLEVAAISESFDLFLFLLLA